MASASSAAVAWLRVEEKTADCLSARDLTNDAVATRCASGRPAHGPIGWHGASHVDMRPLACEFDQLSASVVLQKTVEEVTRVVLICWVTARFTPTWTLRSCRGESSDGLFGL